ncbi:hypothetical protein Tco_1509874 [Tanacetum coccineum]
MISKILFDYALSVSQSTAESDRSYKGTNLVAVGMDDNNKILPIAMGLKARPVHHGPGLCAGKKIRGIFWKTCKAYTTHEFDTLLAVLRGYKPDGVQKLKITGFDKWFVQKLLVTRLVEDFRGLLQRWSQRSKQVCDLMLVTSENDKSYLSPVLPPVMVKQPAGRPKITNHILSKGEASSLDGCTRHCWMKNGQGTTGYTRTGMFGSTRAKDTSTNVNSCPTQIVPVQFTEDAMGIMGMLNSMLNDVTEAPSTTKSHPQRSTMSPTENVPDITTEDRVYEMWKGDGSTSLSGCDILKTWKW